MRLDQIQKCAVCGEGLSKDGHEIVFYRVSIAQEVIDYRAIQQVHGLEQLMGGNIALARVFSPVTEVSKEASNVTGYLCQPCFLASRTADTWEAIAKEKSPDSPMEGLT